MNLVKVKDLHKTTISDIKKLNNFFICRTKRNVFAIDDSTYDVIWETEIVGETKIDLDKVLIFNENIIVFSSNKSTGRFHIYSLDKNGQVNWNVLSDFRPIDNYGIIEVDGTLIYRGYNGQSQISQLVKRSLSNGEQISSVDLTVKVRYLVKGGGQIYFLGMGGVFLYEDEIISKLLSEPVESIIIDNGRTYFLAQSGVRGKYELGEFIGNDIQFLTEIELENGDRSFITPLIQNNVIFQSAGMKKGGLCMSINDRQELWSYQGAFISLSFLPFSQNEIVLFTMNDMYDQQVTLLNRFDGVISRSIPLDDDPVYVFSIDEVLFIGGFNGVEIITTQKS